MFIVFPVLLNILLPVKSSVKAEPIPIKLYPPELLCIDAVLDGDESLTEQSPDINVISPQAPCSTSKDILTAPSILLGTALMLAKTFIVAFVLLLSISTAPATVMLLPFISVYVPAVAAVSSASTGVTVCPVSLK